MLNKDAVVRHIRRHHPFCPDFAVEYFANKVATRKWSKASLGKAVGIVMQTYLRHNMTDYDTLLLTGMGKHAARRRVQPKINAMIASWSHKPIDG